jgi:predicted nucleotidyltransferase
MIATDLKLPLPLKTLSQILRDHGVVQASVFGSYARGEQTPQSDLDLYITCKNGVSFFDLFELQNALEEEAGIPVDLITKINPNFIEYIKPDIINIQL